MRPIGALSVLALLLLASCIAAGAELQSEEGGVLEYRDAAGGGRIAWHALVEPVSARASVTVRTRVRIAGDEGGARAGLSGVQEIWLVGLSTEPGGSPDAAALVWTLDRSSWVPVWRLRITSALGLLPGPDRASLALSTAARPREGTEYVAEMGYDGETGFLAFRLVEGETGAPIASGTVQTRPYSGPLWPGAGMLVDHGSPARIFVGDFDAVPVFVPVGARLYVASRSGPEAGFSRLAPVEAADRRNEIAFEIVAPGGPASGTFTVTASDGRAVGTLRAGESGRGSAYLPVPQNALTPGTAVYSLKYEADGWSWEVDRVAQPVGHIDVRLSELERASDNGQTVRGVLSFAADVPVSTPVVARSRSSEMNWDVEHGRFREGAVRETALPLFDIVVGPDGADHGFSLPLGEGERLSLWRVNLSVFAEALGTTTHLERVIGPVADPACGVRIMSFNILFPTPETEAGPNAWRHRRSLAMEVVRGVGPIVIGFQEPWDIQLHDIDQALPEYDRIVVSPNGRWNNAIYYDTGRAELLDWGRFWYSDRPETPGSSWSDRGGRAAVWGLFKHLASGKSFYVFNTHLRAGADAEADQERIRSAALLKEMVGAIAGDQPVFVLGDFNARAPDHPAHQALVGGEGPRLFDAWESAAWREGPTGTNHQLTGYTGHQNRIDWILFGGPVMPVAMEHIEARRGPLFPSDHLPIAGSFCFL